MTLYLLLVIYLMPVWLGLLTERGNRRKEEKENN